MGNRQSVEHKESLRAGREGKKEKPGRGNKRQSSRRRSKSRTRSKSRGKKSLVSFQKKSASSKRIEIEQESPESAQNYEVDKEKKSHTSSDKENKAGSSNLTSTSISDSDDAENSPLPPAEVSQSFHVDLPTPSYSTYTSRHNNPKWTNQFGLDHTFELSIDTMTITSGGGTSPTDDSPPESPLITGVISDVKTKFHINPKELGHGHYGVVRKCMNRETKEWYAIKSIRKSKVGKIELLKREIAILKEMDHPNIIKLYEVHEDTKYLHLITELCTGGELFDRIIAKTETEEGHFSERDASKIVFSILKAIEYCHDAKNICHRDLKPENFLFYTAEEGSPIKIIDFGLSRNELPDSGIMQTKVGTPYYVAPEVLRREYTKSCDIWSIGVITYILLCGYPPFYGDNDAQIFKSVRAGVFDFPSPDWDDISAEAKGFICALLKKDSKERMTAAQALKHPWFRRSDKKKLSPTINFDNTKSVSYKQFMGMNKLKKAALAFIAMNLTEGEVGVLNKILHEIDRDGNGKLTLEELDRALQDGNFPSSICAELIAMRETLNVSGGNSLDWKEFLASTAEKNLLYREDKIRAAFEYFDHEHSNTITRKDMIRVFGSEKQAQEVMGTIDLDGDGVISYNEFSAMMRSVRSLDVSD